MFSINSYVSNGSSSDLKIDATHFLSKVINAVLNDKYFYGDSNDIFEYYSHFIDLVEFLIKEDVIPGGTIPDDPYPTDLETYINDSFLDYF